MKIIGWHIVDREVHANGTNSLLNWFLLIKDDGLKSRKQTQHFYIKLKILTALCLKSGISKQFSVC